MKVIGAEENLHFIPKDEALLREDPVSSSRTGGKAYCSQNQIAEVTDSLLLCGAPAVSIDRLLDLGVTCVVSAAPELPDTPVPTGVSFIKVHLEDHPSADLSPHLHLVADTIERIREQGGKTLVHCVAGISRSAALCLGYLIKYCRMPLRKAFTHLRTCRSCVRPNSGFFKQLIDYEELHLGTSTVSMVHNPVVGAPIPDVYESEYQAMIWLQQHYGRCLGRH